MDACSNFIIVTGRIQYIDDKNDIFELLLFSENANETDVFVVKIPSELFEDISFKVENSVITVVGYPTTDERCRLTIIPYVIVSNRETIYKDKNFETDLLFVCLDGTISNIRGLLSSLE